MKNVANTEAYSAFDHFFLKALRSVSHIVSVSKLTQPFWGRWRASDIGDDVLFEFLSSIRNLDDWPDSAMRMASRERDAFENGRAGLSRDDEVRALRRLSYMCNLGQWGILPLGEPKLSIYRMSRDYYIEAEERAFGDRYRRMPVRWNGRDFPANLHLPHASGQPAPLIVVIHGLDDCKEEHLATELALVDAGFAVVGFDGPGQGEAFLLDRVLWTPDYAGIVSAMIDAVADHPHIDAERTGTVGFSIGSMWSLLAASRDGRIKAVYDLGAPINTKSFARVPFLIKSKMCQITGARTREQIAEVLAQNYLDTPEILAGIGAAVRIAHGLKDRVVATRDKLWLRDELLRLGRSADVSLITFDDGDHCCTNHVPAIRGDMAEHFRRHLLQA
jgi:alpha-beta hydrolase superfamily lysophospholipase